jgi:hypothetical protein
LLNKGGVEVYKHTFWVAILLALLWCCEVQSAPEVFSYDFSSWGRIKESIQSHHWNPGKTLVILDIDQTLLDTQTFIGSPAWFNWQKSLYDQQSADAIGYQPDHRLSFNDFLPINNFVLGLVSVHLCESSIPAVISHWQKKGYTVMAVTSRSPGSRFATLGGLLLHRIDFKSLLSPDRSYAQGKAVYLQGVLFTSGGNKAVNLVRFLKNANQTRWSHLIVVDDTQKNLTAFSASLPLYPIMSHLQSLALYHYSRDIPFPGKEALQKIVKTDRRIYQLYQRYKHSGLLSKKSK